MTQKVSLPLGKRPQLVNCGLGEHGLRGTEEYELPKLWCLHLYFYAVEMEAGGEVYSIVPGGVTLIPPRTRIIYRYNNKRHRHFFVHFGGMSGNPKVSIPLWQHLPNARDELLDRLQNVQRLQGRNKLRAEILFWGILWDIAEAGEAPEPRERRGPSLLRTMEEFIEDRLPAWTSVEDLAAFMKLTPTHTNRIVRRLMGITAAQLIRKKRLLRAYRLLLHSTMPIKLLAAECGISDLQQFNKLMRSTYGKSPRELREEMKKENDPTWALDRE